MNSSRRNSNSEQNRNRAFAEQSANNSAAYPLRL